jgi:hypothetical protein
MENKQPHSFVMILEHPFPLIYDDQLLHPQVFSVVSYNNMDNKHDRLLKNIDQLV